MRKLTILFSLLVLGSMILAACAPGGATATAPTGGGGEVSLTSKDPTTFVDTTIGGIDTLDPALAYDTASGEVLQNVYETLVFYDGGATDKFVPMLAESWELSDDGMTYTFHIRSGVKFHEGGDLTPSDVAYSFQRGLLQGGTASPQWLLAEPFFGVGNDDISVVVDPNGNLYDDRETLAAWDPAAELAACQADATTNGTDPAECTTPKSLVEACQQVQAAIVADDAAGTVTMTLATPWGPFFPTIAQTWGSVMDKEWVVENGGWDGSCDTWQNTYAMTSEEDPFSLIANGTGPFTLASIDPSAGIFLDRNDNYWREPASLAHVNIQVIPEWGTRFAMMQAGDADTTDVPVENRSQMDEMVGERCEFDLAANEYKACEVTDATKPMRLYIGRPGLVMDVILFNFNINENSPYIGSGRLSSNVAGGSAGIPTDFFTDAHIRKGFAYAFDWDTFINDVYTGEAVQSLTLPLPGMPGYDLNSAHYTLDLEASATEFKLADVDHDGIAAGDDPEGDVWTTGFYTLMLYNQGNTTRQIVAEILAENLAKVNENFHVEALGLPWPTYLRSQRAFMLPILTGGWLEDIHDPHNWYQPYTLGAYGARQRLPDDLKAQFRDILNRGVAETDPAARHQIYLEANQLYYDQVPGVPIVLATSHGFEQRWVHGRILNPIFPGTYYYTISKD